MSASEHGETNRVAGLDTIRFVCALWVLFGHLGFVPFPFTVDTFAGSTWLGSDERVGSDGSTWVGYLGYFGNLIAGAYRNAVSAQAAVIVFFVISGFCIHYPFRNGASIPLKSYYSRRYARVLIPMVATIALGHPLGIRLDLLTHSILWSLVCEEIYYLLYPGLLRLRRAVGMKALALAAFLLALLVIVVRNPRAGHYPSFGVELNWVVGLPCWLFGCVLAEADWGAAPSRRQIWLLRAGVWIASSSCSVLQSHGLGYPWTLNVFAVFAAYWLAREIAYARNNLPSPLLERAGKWSYSIYLVHHHAAAVQARFEVPALSPVPHFVLTTSFALGFSYAFFRLVEKPSHEFARRIGRFRLRPAPAAAPVPLGQSS